MTTPLRRLTKVIGLILAVALCPAPTASAATGTILFVVINSASLTTEETARKTLMEGWGYTVTPISATASSGSFNTAVLTASLAYVSETITSTDLNTKLKATTIPVINEEPALSDDFGVGSTSTTYSTTAIDVSNTSHYITSQFSSGSLTIFSSSQSAWYPTGTLGGYTTLCKKVGTSSPVLTIMERGDALEGGGTAAGRRVCLPWGSSLTTSALNANAQTIMQRAIEWCLLPIGWWKLDDASGSTAADSSGNAHTGTLVSSPVWSTGKKAGCLKFNGSTNYVSIPDDTDFKPTNAVTIAAWIKGNAAWPTGSNVAAILRKGDANPNNFQLCIANGGKVELNIDCGDNDGVGTDGSTTLSTGAWYHVAGTWDGAKVRIYVNGVIDNTPKAYATAMANDTRPVYLGGRLGSTDVTDGWVDDVRFYNRCLTAAEIAALAKANPSIATWQGIAPP